MSNFIRQGLHIVNFAPKSLGKNIPSSLQLRYRKPPSMGRAQTKDDKYFTKHPPTPKDLAKNLELYNNYNIIMRSIVCAFQEEMSRKGVTESDETNTRLDFWDEKSHHAKCMAYNDEINKEINEQRMQRIKEQWKQQEIEFTEAAKAKEDSKLKEQIEEMKKESENWLTMENMEELITEAIDNPINYNFSVTKKGIIHTRTPQVL
ncbi:small ribosomal subunit protein mS26-like [Ciona intestinalis]